jgi:hypothetical protein
LIDLALLSPATGLELSLIGKAECAAMAADSCPCSNIAKDPNGF